LWFSRYSKFLTDINRYFKSIADICRYFRSIVDICRYFGSVADISRYSVLVEFGGNLRLVDPSGFLRFLFRIGIVGYKTFLLATRGSK